MSNKLKATVENALLNNLGITGGDPYSKISVSLTPTFESAPVFTAMHCCAIPEILIGTPVSFCKGGPVRLSIQV